MKQLQLNGYMLGVVDVPEDAHSFLIDDELFYKAEYMGMKDITRMVRLDPGQWSILGRLNDITEEQAAKLVKIIDGNRYENYNGDYPIWYYSAFESIQSFFRSNGIEGNQLIILNEKVKEKK